MSAGERPSSRSLGSGLLPALALTLALTAALTLALTTTPATATPIISAGNIPFSGISPGGVNMSTGELILVMRPDLVVNGPSPLVFRRYYASMLQREGIASGRLGPNWLHTYDWRLTFGPGSAAVVTNRGELIRFTSGAGGSWTLLSPLYSRFKLDTAGALFRFTNSVDRHIYFFDGSGNLTQILDEHGNALNLTYPPGGGALSQVSDGLGRILNFTYDPTSGLLSQVSDGTRFLNFGYTTGVLTNFIDAAGKPWNYSVNPGPIQALITGIIEPLGNTPITHAYDPLGRVASQTDALIHTATYTYDTPTGNVYTDPQTNPWTYQHDPLKLTSLKDPNGGNTNIFYDPQGRISSVARPMSDATSFDYDFASGYVSAVHYPDVTSVFFDHGSHGVGGATIFDVTGAHYPDGANVVYGRDGAGNLTNYLDQLSFPWTGTYNSRGQILTWTNPSGGVTTYTYDIFGRPNTVQDNAGNTASYNYDPLSRLIQVNWPGGATHRHFTYDNRDNLTLVQDESGNPWTYAYDDNGRLTTATDPLLHATGYVYDNVDRVTQVVDPLSHATLYDYDLNGRLFHETDRSGRVTTYQYDALNRLTSVADPMGAPMTFGHDGDGRVIFAQDALGHSSIFQYDFMDRLTHMTDQVLSEFDYQYDPMGRLKQVTGPLGYFQSFQYDPRGLLRSATNGTSTTQYEYTPHQRLSKVTDPNSNPWFLNFDPQGRLQNAADPLGRSYGYEYDGLNRLMRITRPDFTAEQINYDLNGNVTGLSYSDGTTFTYGYDIANRMTSAGPDLSFTYDNAGRMTGSGGFGYTHDQEGRLLSQTIAPGKTESYNYDPRGLLSQVSDWVGGNTTFDHDAAHRLRGITRPNGTSVGYQYDNADRMTSAVETQPGPIQISSIQITRDALGRTASINRSQPLMPGATSPATSSFAYDPASQVNGVGHDPLGRTTVDGARALGWNGASQLKSYAHSADSLNFTDDPFKHPKTIKPPTGQVVQLAWGYGRGYPTNDDMAVSLPSRWRLNVRTPSGLLLHSVDGVSGARSFYHYDEAGNTAFLTNNGGNVTTGYAYGPFGGVSALGQTADNPFTFGAARGLMSLGTNAVSTGLWHGGGGVYDERTMRVVSALATASGEKNPGPISVNPGPVQSGWANPGPIQSNPGPSQSQPGPISVGPGPIQSGWSNPGPVQGQPGPIQVQPGPSQSQPGPVQVGPGPIQINPGPINGPGDVSGPYPHPWGAGGDVSGPYPHPWASGGDAQGPHPQPWAPGDLVGLNPQPFPPAPGEWVGLNPQPFPPSPYAPDAVTLNPQPFPPGGTLMSYSGGRNGMSSQFGSLTAGADAHFKKIDGLKVHQQITEYPQGGAREHGTGMATGRRQYEPILITPSDEIHADKYGRIKVAFPWDRPTSGESTNCTWCPNR